MAVSPDLRDLLLNVGQQRDLDGVLASVCQELADLDPIALARAWLLQPGDICASCPMRRDCPDQARCLHLVASAGRSSAQDGKEWNQIDGSFRRFPLGVRKVGRIAASGECVAVPNIASDATWIADPQWAQDENILGFSGQPLIFKGEILGVLAIFTRATLTQGCLDWLRMIADFVAASVANAIAFEKIESLHTQLEMENAYLREEVSDARSFGGLIGQSPALRTIVQQIELVAPTDANVLVLGESGTGKELVAQEIHNHSQRSSRPLVRVNCGSIPRDLYESEFFGHVQGAFTGAVRDRPGRFELANGGTLFLDEVGEIPLPLQSKLLRVLQEGTYERVGDDRTRQVDARIVAATNRDLKADVSAGRFRQDLYYRLNVFPIEVPPLRQRKEDLGALAIEFLHRAATRFNRPQPTLTQNHIIQLQTYDWPGNVRELMNVIERAVITTGTGKLRFELPAATSRSKSQERSRRVDGVVSQSEVRRLEINNMLAALEQADWRVAGPGGAAERLGMRPTTLASRIKRLGLERRD
jgi:transcriptional regulator with GAF, ATPase, and Fis domain